MKNSKCPNCGSTEIYVSEQPFTDTLCVKSKTKSTESFETEAYLCLVCRKLELYVSEKSVVLFGKAKTLLDSLPLSENWKKLPR